MTRDEAKDGSHAGEEVGRAPISSPNLKERKMPRPMYYHRDGTPFSLDPARTMDETLQWATEFETADRSVGNTMTPYGERLSTIFLGMDHSFMRTGPPLLFETMLFAPDPSAFRRAFVLNRDDPRTQMVYDRFIAHTKKHFPHDQLQLRYSTEQEARESHAKLRLQCLIPPRWRRWLCYEIGGDETWS